MKHRLYSRMLSACLAAALTAALALPAFASGSADYKAADGTTHSVLWTKGIAEPQLPSDGNGGDFAPASVTLGSQTLEVTAAPHSGAQSWFDLTVPKDSAEPQAVAAASAANLTYWWILQNLENIGTYLETAPAAQDNLSAPGELYELQISPASQTAAESPIYKMYLENMPGEAKPDQMLDFFLNGYKPSGDAANTPESFAPAGKGGYLNPVVGKNLLTRRETADFNNLKDAVQKNDGAIISVNCGNETRFMNVWGIETDEAGRLCALLVTDSKDELGMVRYPASAEAGLLIGGMEVTGLYCLNLGEVLWMDYAPSKPAETTAPETKPAETTAPETKPAETTAPQVQWGDTTYEWSDNLNTCTAKRVAKDDPSRVETENANAVSEQTQAPTSKDPGIMTYTAQFQSDWAKTQVKTREIPKTEANWDVPTYEWDESMRVCKATRKDKNNPSIVETAEGVISSRITKEPTCTAKGQTTFTAEFDVDWAEKQEKVLDDIAQLEPIWGETEYRWSQDHRTCTAVRTCKHEADGSHKQTAEATMSWETTKRPTSQAPGETTYTAQFNVSWASTQKYTAADVPALGESWNAPTYEWSDDLRICYAKRTDKNDPSRVQTAEAGVVSQETKAPTCTEKGETTYTAAFQEDWAQTQTLVKQNIPTLQPNWGETQYRWSDDYRSCTAVRVCKNEKGHEQTAQGKVSSQVTLKPTVSSKGETTYTVVFDVDWAQNQKFTRKDVPELENRWNPTEYQWSSDMSKCTATRKNVNDPNMVETASAKVTSKKTKAPTSTDKGETTYTAVFDVDWAKTQQKTLANIPPVSGNPNGNKNPTSPTSWNETTYEWSEDHSRCTARRTKKGDESTVDLTWGTVTKKEVKAPTCAESGEAVFTAKFTESWAKEQTVKAKVEPLAHKLQKVEEVKATAGKEGIQAHYQCSECKKLFADPEGKREVTLEQLKLNKPTVSDGYAILNGVPEKDSQVALSPDKFSQALTDNPGSVGVSIAVGSCSLAYDKKDVETIVNAAGDNKKIQLEIYKANATDSALTLEQIQTAEQNPGRDLYVVQLSYVQNGKSLPVEGLSGTTVTVPYAGTDAVRAYQIKEDGSVQEVSCRFADNFLSFAGGNGVYLLSETAPEMEAPQKSGSKVGVIIWSAVLVVSGLLVVGLLGFYFYQKKLEAEENEKPHKFSAGGSAKPRLDQNFSTDEILDYDEGYFDEPVMEQEEQKQEQDDFSMEDDPELAELLSSYEEVTQEKPASAAPKTAAKAPKTAAQAPKAAPQAPKAAPQTPKAAPQAPKAAPQAPKAATQAPKAAPQAPKAAPQAPKAAPQAPKAASQAPKAAPQAPKTEAQVPKTEAKTPLAPKAPMEQKPTIAEKTAENVNHKHSKV